MLTIHATRSLSRRLRVRFDTEDAVESTDDILTRWFGNDFRLGRTEFAIFSNPVSCLPIVMHAAPYKDLVSRFRDQLPQELCRYGWANAPADFYSRIDDGTRFLRTADRSTIGVMVEFVKFLKVVHDHGELDLGAPAEMGFQLANILISARGFFTPLEMFQREMGIASPRTTPDPNYR
jgi:hypothetical protein